MTHYSAYDEWRLSGPEELPEIGTDDGQTCGRYSEPDEDQPRGYQAKPCRGTMQDEGGIMICDTCWEIV